MSIITAVFYELCCLGKRVSITFNM